MKIRILPVTILTCALFLGGKTLNLVQASHAQGSEAAAHAQEKPEADKVEVVDDNNTSSKAKDEVKETEAAKEEDKKDEKSDEKSDDGHGKKEEKKGEHGSKEKEEPKMPDNVHYERPQENIPQFTDSEKEVLQKLADRRAELDAYAKDLDLRASLIDASSKKVDEKLAELKKLQADTETILKTYNEHEEVKIKSLVKIYENMKPTAAAGIFEQMEMVTLLEIIDKMSEKKASAVLAVMSPSKAKEITQKLAEEKSLRKQAPAASAKPPVTPTTAAQATAQAAQAITPPPASITPPPAGAPEKPAEAKPAEEHAAPEAKPKA